MSLSDRYPRATEDEIEALQERVLAVAQRLFRAYVPADFRDPKLAALATGLLAIQLLKHSGADIADRRAFLQALGLESRHLADWRLPDTVVRGLSQATDAIETARREVLAANAKKRQETVH